MLGHTYFKTYFGEHVKYIPTETHRYSDAVFDSGSDSLIYVDADNRLHCDEGPAIVNSQGTKGFFLHGIEYSESEYWKIVNNVSSDNLKDVQQIKELFL